MQHIAAYRLTNRVAVCVSEMGASMSEAYPQSVVTDKRHATPAAVAIAEHQSATYRVRQVTISPAPL